MALPSIGQALRVRLRETATDYYTSRLVEISNQALYIEVPLHHTARVPFDVQTVGQFWIEYHGQDGAICRFETKVLEVVRVPMLAWRIPMPNTEDIQREQRREFVRVSTDLPVRLDYVDHGGSHNATVHARDISGGGLALWLPRNVTLRPGILVNTKFTLPTGDFPVDVKCTVIRVSDRNDRGLATASMQFYDLKEAVRQRIIQYTFWRQRYLKN